MKRVCLMSNFEKRRLKRTVILSYINQCATFQKQQKRNSNLTSINLMTLKKDINLDIATQPRHITFVYICNIQMYEKFEYLETNWQLFCLYLFIWQWWRNLFHSNYSGQFQTFTQNCDTHHITFSHNILLLFA